MMFLDWLQQQLPTALHGFRIGFFIFAVDAVAILSINTYRARKGLPPLRRGWPYRSLTK